MNRVEAIDKINTLATQGNPFLFVIDFEQTNITVLPLAEAAANGIFYDIQGKTNYTPSYKKLPAEIIFSKQPIDFQQYKKGFDIVQKGLHRGDSFLVNLTYPTPIKTNLSLEAIFEHSKAKYKLLFKTDFVCFSPEIFVKINADGVISSYPMKGTIDANLPNAEATILADAKEKAEHNTIVDLIRNDLSQIAKKVSVSRFRYIDHLKTNHKDLLQVSSEITGVLPDDWQQQLGTLLFRLLPAGSISGAPKPSTLQIIHQAEMDKRGYYTGIFGIFDGKTLDSSVIIRFIAQDTNGNKTFRSGGGITVFAKAKEEYQELIDKVYIPINKL